MLEVKVQSVILRAVHYGQIHSLRADPVGIPFCLVADISQLIQPFLFQSQRLICK